MLLCYRAIFDPGHAEYVGEPQDEGKARYYFGLILWAIYNLTIGKCITNNDLLYTELHPSHHLDQSVRGHDGQQDG